MSFVHQLQFLVKDQQQNTRPTNPGKLLKKSVVKQRPTNPKTQEITEFVSLRGRNRGCLYDSEIRTEKGIKVNRRGRDENLQDYERKRGFRV